MSKLKAFLPPGTVTTTGLPDSTGGVAEESPTRSSLVGELTVIFMPDAGAAFCRFIERAPTLVAPCVTLCTTMAAEGGCAAKTDTVAGLAAHSEGGFHGPPFIPAPSHILLTRSLHWPCVFHAHAVRTNFK